MIQKNQDIEIKVKDLRKDIFRMICSGGGGHIPGSLSPLHILTVLYYQILRINPADPENSDRDRFILSKGHCGTAQYAILADLGFFDKKLLMTFGKTGTILGGHPDRNKIPGIEASTGSLGHGLSFGTGIALAGKKDRKDYRVFVLLGDGECQEGSVWEAAMFASHSQLDNLTAIIDYNKFQAMDRLEKIVGMEPLKDRWKSFGWSVQEVDGHNITQLNKVFRKVPFKKGKPSLIIANTIKGKGISFMENVPIWHYRMPNEKEMKIVCKELGL